MTGLPAVRPARPRFDETAADTDTLVDMGVLPEQPVPPHEGLFLEPDWPPLEE